MSDDTCINGCDLRGEPIPQEYIDKGYYGDSTTHYSRKVAVEIPGVYDGAVAWWCPDCGARWPRLQAFKDHPVVVAWLNGVEV